MAEKLCELKKKGGSGGSSGVSGAVSIPKNTTVHVDTGGTPTKLGIIGYGNLYYYSFIFDEDYDASHTLNGYTDNRSGKPAGQAFDKVSISTAWRGITITLTSNGFDFLNINADMSEIYYFALT